MTDVIYLMGIANCGSSLFGLQMGSHSQCACVGEIFQQSDPRKKTHWRDCCTCGRDCHLLTEKFLASLNYKNQYQRLSELFPGRRIVDVSKAPAFFSNYLAPAYADTDFRLIPILLYKTPFESFASRKLRRESLYRPGWTIADYFNAEWIPVHGECLAAIEKHEGAIISYKDFAGKNIAVLRFICFLLGINYEEGMNEYWNHEHHALGRFDLLWIPKEADRIDRYKKLVGEVWGEKQRKRYFKKICYIEKHHEVLTEEEIQSINDNEEVMRIFKQMESRKAVIKECQEITR